MQIIDVEGIKKWLFKYDIGDLNDDNFSSNYLIKKAFKIPSDAGKKTVLAGTIGHNLNMFPETLIWINEYGIWPSSENMNLFNTFRLGLGENRNLQEKPGHICTSIEKDLEIAISLISIVLYFSWGAIIAPATGEMVIRISHDEFVNIYVNKNAKINLKFFEVINKIILD